MAGLAVGLIWHWKQMDKAGGIRMGGSSVIGHISTDAQGRFTFPHLPAGDFDYGVASSTDQYVPIRANSGSARPTRKGPPRRGLDWIARSGRRGGRAGRRAGPWRVSIRGGSDPSERRPVQVGDFWQMPSSGKTDVQGHYQVRVTPGDVFVGVGRIDDGRASNRRNSVRGAPRECPGGQTASAPDIPVSLKPIIVFVGPDGQPVANATVRITAADMTKGAYITEDRRTPPGPWCWEEAGAARTARAARSASRRTAGPPPVRSTRLPMGRS